MANMSCFEEGVRASWGEVKEEKRLCLGGVGDIFGGAEEVMIFWKERWLCFEEGVVF